MLPLFQSTLEDIVYEVLNEREIPNRTQFSEVRDVVNNLRGPVSSATSAIKKLEKRITDLERRVDELQSP
jgi:polyhydroxyalkanoate synthesis regulator phasin